MSKKIAVGMLAACALAGIGARGEELNVADGDTGVLTIVGEAVKPSGHAVLAVGDPSRYSVAIASALAAEGWKLRETAGVYSLCRPGLCLVVR